MNSLENAFYGLIALLALLVLVGGNRNSDTSFNSAVMIYKQRSSENVQGCYHQNDSLALCFNIQATFIELNSGDNSTLVRFSELPHDMFIFQILNDAFIG